MRGLDEIMAQNAVMIILGLGDEAYHEKLLTYQNLYPRRLAVNLKFDDRLAHRIYAASDFFLMPSRYEPCGLGQLISFRYGTIPIVRYTGGLADTVIEYDPGTENGNGFGFREYTPQELVTAISRAISLYQDKKKLARLSKKCMEMNFSWAESAKKYVKLYDRLISG
jgi:starch synthase